MNIPTDRWRIFPDHITAAELRQHLGPSFFDDYYKFAIVRNPWDLQVSRYHYIRGDRRHTKRHIVRELADFEAYIYWMKENPPLSQAAYVVAHDGSLLVDRVGRFEQLPQDFNEIAAHLGIRAALPHFNRSNRRDYHSYYSEQTKRVVEDVFSDDIAQFGYTY